MLLSPTFGDLLVDAGFGVLIVIEHVPAIGEHKRNLVGRHQFPILIVILVSFVHNFHASLKKLALDFGYLLDVEGSFRRNLHVQVQVVSFVELVGLGGQPLVLRYHPRKYIVRDEIAFGADQHLHDMLAGELLDFLDPLVEGLQRLRPESDWGYFAMLKANITQAALR